MEADAPKEVDTTLPGWVSSSDERMFSSTQSINRAPGAVQESRDHHQSLNVSSDSQV